MRATFIAWTRFDHRSQLLAKNLGATMHFVFHGQQGKLFQLPCRYFTQGLHTWRILIHEHPDIIFVQNPPIFSVLVAFLYSKLHKARYVIDSHTAAFLSPIWRRTLGLQCALSRQALATIVHNESQEEIVKIWGCNYHVLSDPLKGYPKGTLFPLAKGFNIAVISTFSEDEPLEVVFESAGLLTDVAFYITGDSKRIPSSLLAKKPANCQLTGFLPYDQYVGLLKGVDVIMDLTTRDHTLLCGAFEAVSLGKPLITSNWKILRNHFPIGTIHIPNTAEGVCEGIRQAQLELSTLQRDILILKEKLLVEWDQKFAKLLQLLSESRDKEN